MGYSFQEYKKVPSNLRYYGGCLGTQFFWLTGSFSMENATKMPVGQTYKLEYDTEKNALRIIEDFSGKKFQMSDREKIRCPGIPLIKGRYDCIDEGKTILGKRYWVFTFREETPYRRKKVSQPNE